MAKQNSRRSKRRSKQRTTPKSDAEKLPSKSIDVAEDEAFNINNLANSNVDEPWPCLLICHGWEHKQIFTFFNVSQQQHLSKFTQELTDKYVCWTHGEWFVIQDSANPSDCCILNVVTGEKVQLPPLAEDVRLRTNRSFVLSSSSPTTDANCCVFFFNGVWNFNISCQIGAKKFSRQELNVREEWLRSAIIFQGKMYCITFPERTLYCSDLADSKPHRVEFREFINGEILSDLLLVCGHLGNYLIESCGQLLYAEKFAVGLGVAEFHIFRADLCGKTWERVTSIGDDRAIFVDGWRAFSASTANCGLKGNCVYFVEQEDGCLYVYDLEDQCVLKPSPQFPLDTQGREMRWLLINSPHPIDT